MIKLKPYTLLFSIILVIYATNAQEICKICTCDDTTKLVDCSSRNLTLAFNETSLWINEATNQTLDVLEFNFHDNDLASVFPFPKLNIKKMDLSGNRIIKIAAESFKGLTDMVELDLSDNHLMSEYLTSDVFMGPFAPEDSEPLRSLQILRLSKNALHTLHPDLFEHTDRIEILMLDSNPFSVIDRVTLIAISTLPRLKVLDLSNTDIKTLPLFMLHTPMHLTMLNLSGNEIQELPKTLGDVHKLEWLSLSNNPIESLSEPENIFPQIPTLKVLQLTNMPKLHSIEKGALSGLTSLQELYLSNNKKLATIDSKALSRIVENSTVDKELWPELKILEIQSNNLSRIDHDLIGNWARLQHIDIRYNNFICDCENQWLVSTLVPIIQGLHDQSLLSHGVRCASPPEMRGRNLTELFEKGVKMRCLDVYGARPEKDGSILVGILIGVLVTIPIMMAVIMFCYKRNYCGLINAPRSPADFSRNFYKRAEMNDDNYM